MSNVTKALICVVVLLIALVITLVVFVSTPPHSGFPLMIGGVVFTISILCLGFLFDPQPQY